MEKISCYAFVLYYHFSFFGFSDLHLLITQIDLIGKSDLEFEYLSLSLVTENLPKQ